MASGNALCLWTALSNEPPDALFRGTDPRTIQPDKIVEAK